MSIGIFWVIVLVAIVIGGSIGFLAFCAGHAKGYHAGRHAGSKSMYERMKRERAIITSDNHDAFLRDLIAEHNEKMGL